MKDMDEGQWAPLVDVVDKKLVDLLASTDTALARATKRVVESVNDPDGVISAFGSFAGEPQ